MARRTEAARKIRSSQEPVRVRDPATGKTSWARIGQHRTGDHWWRTRFADMVERRDVVNKKRGHSRVTYRPRAAPQRKSD